MKQPMCNDPRCGGIHKCIICHIFTCRHFIKAFGSYGFIKDWPKSHTYTTKPPIRLYCEKHSNAAEMLLKITNGD